MPRFDSCAIGLIVMLAAGTFHRADAQDVHYASNASSGAWAGHATPEAYAPPAVVHIGTPPPSGRYHFFRRGVRGRHGLHAHDYTHYDFLPAAPESYSHAPHRPHYPYLHAAMYPAPRPNVPIQVGGTLITNQALSPHEMLYPHEYHALYPPYYYSVRGRWMVTPLGVWSVDEWKLRGTEVEVEYKPRIGLLSGFFPLNGR